MPAERFTGGIVALAFACIASACGFGHDVEHNGTYTVRPSAKVTDSAPYPLETLLFVQYDVKLAQTRLYAFRGDLRRADLGIEDLKKIAYRHGGSQMAFDAPTRRLDADVNGEVKGRGKPLRARVGDRDLELVRLDDSCLPLSGADRYLRSVTSIDYRIAAYFGVIDSAEMPDLIELGSAGLRYEPNTSTPELQFEHDDTQGKLKFQAAADYVVVELVQQIKRKPMPADGGMDDAGAADAAVPDAGVSDDEDAGTNACRPLATDDTVDALVRTTLAPNSEYLVTRPFMTDVAGQGCWSHERPLQARLHQIARSYQPRASGDAAIVYERMDEIELASEAWTSLLDGSKSSEYCVNFE